MRRIQGIQLSKSELKRRQKKLLRKRLANRDDAGYYIDPRKVKFTPEGALP